MRIKDICSGVTDGSHNPPQGLENSDYLMLSSKNVFDDKITFDSPRYLSQIDFEQESKRTRIKSGDVLLTIVGTVGRAAVVGENMPQFTLQRSVAVLHPNVEICDSRYLMYALQANRNHIESRAKGVAQKGIYLKEVADIELQIPLLSEQTHRVKVLDKIAFVIKFHQKQLQKLDELVKARFVELFGDPKQNPKGYPVKEFDEISILITDGEHATPRRTDKGIYLLSARNILNHALQLDDVDYIDEEEYTRIARRVVPQAGDVLISCSGSIGRCCVVPEELQFQMVRSAALIRFDDTIKPVFAEWLITSDELQRQISMSATQSSQANLFQGKIRKLRGYVPPLELQEQFAAFVEQTDKSKVVVQKSLDEAQLLFDSLMQQYFG